MAARLHRDIFFERLLPFPVEAVWAALTEPELVAQWLMPADISAAEGHRFTFRSTPMRGWDGIVRAQVIEATAPRRLTYTWIGSADMPETIVSWFLRPDGGATRLYFSHTGFRGLKFVLIGYFLARGWRDMLDNGLPALLTRRHGLLQGNFPSAAGDLAARPG